MSEIQREPVPRVDTGELDVAHAFLKFQRHCVLKKAEGLTEDQLRRPVVASGTSILGLIQHLAEAERGWFDHHLGGGDWDEEAELGMTVPADRPVDEVIEFYRAAIEASDRAITAAGDPETLMAIPIDGMRKSLRWLLAHMTTETARHAGHADIIREQLDGVTGR
ncbi:DinB family protein [Lentzea sp. NEAU-D13]|uniref:DinB family protein n=1 Tax=Lentzea alba TaxID=2714351 RepID=A0A7C9VTW6_9PSEU|nr:DinB family protein [Lentzea alba]NGY60716.1 DinB family protein [Lentzea alba]